MYKRLFTCLFLLTLLQEQSGASKTGRIEGMVRDAESHAPIAYGYVIMPGTRMGAMTLPDGRFTIVGIEAGTYSVAVTIWGYEQQTIDSVYVAGNQVTQLQFYLAYNDTMQILDCTRGVSPVCEAHDTAMSVTVLNIHPDISDSEYEAARKKYFPNAGRPCSLTGSMKNGHTGIHKDVGKARVFICPKCLEARKEWLGKHESITKKLEYY